MDNNNPRRFRILAYRPAKHQTLNCIKPEEYKELKPLTVYSNLMFVVESDDRKFSACHYITEF
jgi:hypothetical protein